MRHAPLCVEEDVTVAVAFQVVLIMDNAHVIVPQNLAVAFGVLALVSYVPASILR